MIPLSRRFPPPMRRIQCSIFIAIDSRLSTLPPPGAVRALLAVVMEEARADALAAHLDDAEIAHRIDAHARAVLLEKQIGKGHVIVTSIHEFPSRAFLKDFCRSGIQTLF
jgi:hypothetical protein